MGASRTLFRVANSSRSRSFHTTCSRLQASLPDPDEVAARFRSKFQERPPDVRTQLLDANQLQLFSLTLHRPNLWTDVPVDKSPPKPGTPLPPYYHYAYFTVPILEKELGDDGSDRSYNPEPPFTRRMWAGGSVYWPGAAKGNYLRVGEEVTERTKVLSCEPKVIKSKNEPMLVVGVEKEFETKDGVAVFDRRSWIFRQALDPNDLPKPTERKPVLGEAELPQNGQQQGNVSVRRFDQTPVTLFRFSALTFNGHKIHYSTPWCRDVEGHRNIVVHGPMNLINMLDLWRDKKGSTVEEGFPEEIEYRATRPIYAGEPYRVVLGPKEDNAWTGAEVRSDDGIVCMKGRIKTRSSW